MLKIKDQTGKVVGVLKDDTSEPEMVDEEEQNEDSEEEENEDASE